MDERGVDGFDVARQVPGFRPPATPTGACATGAVPSPARWCPAPSATATPPAACSAIPSIPTAPPCSTGPRSTRPRARIVGLPIWDIAVQTEGKARLRMAAYAGTLREPGMRNALALNACEEQRHKDVLARMVASYGIALAPEPAQPWPADPEWAYLVTGYNESIDSFFAFGLFELARRSGLFPQALVDTFEPVMQEECRHILLFANWAAWHRAACHSGAACASRSGSRRSGPSWPGNASDAAMSALPAFAGSALVLLAAQLSWHWVELRLLDAGPGPPHGKPLSRSDCGPPDT